MWYRPVQKESDELYTVWSLVMVRNQWLKTPSKRERERERERQIIDWRRETNSRQSKQGTLSREKTRVGRKDVEGGGRVERRERYRKKGDVDPGVDAAGSGVYWSLAATLPAEPTLSTLRDRPHRRSTLCSLYSLSHSPEASAARAKASKLLHQPAE